MKHAAAVAGNVQLLLSGSTEPDPEQHGMTSEEERAASRTPQVRCRVRALPCALRGACPAWPAPRSPDHTVQAARSALTAAWPACRAQWPGVAASVQPPNNNLKLFGGAAFERCLDEFQEAAHALRFPAGAPRSLSRRRGWLRSRGRCPVQGPQTSAPRAPACPRTRHSASSQAATSHCTPSPPAPPAVARDKIANVLLAYKGKNNHGGGQQRRRGARGGGHRAADGARAAGPAAGLRLQPPRARHPPRL
jgi:hypothetical protein